MIRRVLWLAVTPVAVGILLMAPPSGASKDAGEHEAPAPGEVGAHHVITNPIQNFASFSYAGKDDHGGTYEPDKGDHKMPPPFSMALLNFAALLFIIGKFFAPSIARMTRDRHDRIAKDLAEGARLRDEARKKLEEYQAKLAALDGDIAKLIAELRAEGEAERQRIVADAEARAARLAKDAEQQIQADMTRVRLELEREAVLQAVAMAEKLLKDKTSDVDQRGLVDKFVKNLESAARGRV